MDIKTLSGKDLFRIGLGTYGLAGKMHRDGNDTSNIDLDKSIKAVEHSFSHGINFTEVSIGYGKGKSIEVLKRGIDASSVNREDLFITHSLYPRDLESIHTIQHDTDSFYNTLDTSYADSTLVTMSLIKKFGEIDIYNYLHNLLDSRKTRYVSISNSNPDYIRKFKSEFEDKVFAHEGHISFEIREVYDKGIFRLCDELDIKNVIWRPLRQNKTYQNNWPILNNLSKKYNKSVNQIILNWLLDMGFLPMTLSLNPLHIYENIQSSAFKMQPEDYLAISNFRPDNYNPPKIDWDKTGEGVSIVDIVDNFENYV